MRRAPARLEHHKATNKAANEATNKAATLMTRIELEMVSDTADEQKPTTCIDMRGYGPTTRNGP